LQISRPTAPRSQDTGDLMHTPRQSYPSPLPEHYDSFVAPSHLTRI